MHVNGVLKCNRTRMMTKQTLKYGTVITVSRIILMNRDVKLIDKNKIEVVNRIFFGMSAYGSLKQRNSLNCNL